MVALADPNYDLRMAILGKDLPKLNQALDDGANRLLCDDYNHNWIHLAVMAKFPEAIQVLEAAGVPLHGLNDLGHTPTQLAESNDQTESLRILQKLGARTGTQIELRMSPDPSHSESHSKFGNLFRCFFCCGPTQGF
jgi:hypothetical protein